MLEDKKCHHEYIICFGDDNYCFNCGTKIKEFLFGSLCIDATFYLEECLSKTERFRILREKFEELMLQRGTTLPQLVIEEFKDIVEDKGKKDNQVRGKI